ncbi:MAG: alpha/beta hydrolase [Thermonemataceae bacterium]
MKSKVFILLIILVAIYGLILLVLFVWQEKLLFFPTKLPASYTFQFEEDFEEISIQVEKEIHLNALLFKAIQSKGVILFLHGNAGAINTWGFGAPLYLQHQYDVLYVDYRGYGKSEGNIQSEQQLISDIQKVYDRLKERYSENTIIVSGTSIGTGIATQIAAANHPKLLLLNAPYYSLKKLIQEKTKVLPSFIIRYSLATHQYINKVECPIYLFHGQSDQLIPVHHAKELKQKAEQINLIVLEGTGHNDIPANSLYQEKMGEILMK